MNLIAQAINPSLMPEWANKLQAKINNYSLWNKNKCYFGGGNGGGTEIRYVDPYAGTGIRELYKKITDWIGPQVGQGVTPYAGQIVPGISPMQQMGFDVAQGLTPLATGGMQYFGDILGRADTGAPGRFMGTAEQTLQNVLQPFDPKMLMESLEPARKYGMDIYKQDIMPAIAEKYFSGGEGGAGYRELGRQGANLADQLGAQLASYIFSGSEAQKGRQQAGVGQAMQLAALPGDILQQAGRVGGVGTDMLSQMLNIGTQQRGITGEQLGEEYGKWQFEQPWANPYLTQFLGTALQQPPMQTYAQQQGPSTGSMMMPLLGSMLGSPGMLSGMLGPTGIGGFASGLFSGPGSIVPATAAGSLGGGLQGLLGGAIGGIGSAAGGLLSLLGGI